MKKSITLIAALLGCAALSPTLHAEDEGKRDGKHRERMLEKFDANNDGTLDDEEKAAAREKCGRRGGKFRDRMLKKFDADKDGKLDDTERAAAKEAMQERRKEMKEKFDTNGDGVLDEAERAAAKAAMKERRRGKKRDGAGADAGAGAAE